MKSLHFILLFLVTLTCSFAQGGETTVQGYVDKYYKEWSAQTNVGDSGDPFDSGDFFRSVPSPLQLQVLDKLLQRGIASVPSKGTSFVKLTALQCLEHLMDDPEKMVVNDAIEADLVALLKSRSSSVRWQVVGIFRLLKEDKYRPYFTEALNDPADEVRCEGVKALGNYPDSIDILQKYVAKHQDDPNYKLSIVDAKNAINAMRSGRKFSN